ncbi:hypothetical protein E3V36_04650 [Candidatus Marinimicrobia bacterium MT.SAG.2]|nr:hypothetical protein E3V36_04650 [Candidatus Marinimicrobia bacterium MT.SAG.2]
MSNEIPIRLRLPDFVIIGAQKSASTFLQECIREHPAVYMNREEDAFFEDPEYVRIGIEKFATQFDGIPDDLLIGIKRPNYLAMPLCLERIYTHIPNARLIAILRDPVKRAVSCYFHDIRHGILPICSLNLGMARILNGEYATNYPRSQEILDFGLYYKHLRHYLEYFDRSQLFIRLFEDVRKTPLEVVRQAYSFLGIDTSYRPRALSKRPMKGVHSMWRLRFTSISNKYKMLSEDKMRIYRRPGFYPRVMIRVINGIDKFVLAKFDRSAKPMLNAEIEQQLRSFYAEDIAGLEKLLSIDLSDWK